MTHQFEQNPEAAQVRVCRCGKWPDHHVHGADPCGCDDCRSRPAGPVHVNTLHIDPPRIPLGGGPFRPGDLGLHPSMAIALRESPAWCAYVDQVRQAYAQRYRMRP